MRNGLITIVIIMLLGTAPGCQPEPEAMVEGSAVLMTVGSQEIREDEFRRAYRVFRAAYGAEADEPADAKRASMLRFIQQLADQLVLMEYARESGIVISEGTLSSAVETIRSDYPEGLFEQMLLENAVNFEDWKEALRVRLTIDRLVAKELAEKVQITEEDLAAHYRQHAPGLPLPEAQNGGSERIDQLLVAQLRRQKAEEAYGPWIAQLRDRYTVTIDQAVVQQILSESGIVASESDAARP